MGKKQQLHNQQRGSKADYHLLPEDDEEYSDTTTVIGKGLQENSQKPIKDTHTAPKLDKKPETVEKITNKNKNIKHKANNFPSTSISSTSTSSSPTVADASEADTAHLNRFTPSTTHVARVDEPKSVDSKPQPSVTKSQIDFLKTAIADTQETIRFLDTKAGMIVAFESVLLSGAMFEAGGLEVVQFMKKEGFSLILGSFMAVLLMFSVLVVYHVQLTLKAIFPSENPSKHVDNDGAHPPNTFLLWQTDKRGMMVPTLAEYFRKLVDMTEVDIALEYSSQLLKLSYIRKRKQDILSKSFIWLFGLVTGFILLQALRVIIHLTYHIPEQA